MNAMSDVDQSAGPVPVATSNYRVTRGI